MGGDPDDNENEETPSGAGSQWRGDEIEYILHGICGPVSGPPHPNCQTIYGENVPQTVFQSDSGQGIDSPWTLASLSDEDIAISDDMICRFNGLMSGKTPDRGNWITVLPMKNSKLMVLMFNTIEHSSRDFEIRRDNSTSVL